MLNVSIYPGISYKIGDNITICVKESTRTKREVGRYVLGIDAPKEIPIRRVNQSIEIDNDQLLAEMMAPREKE